MRRALILAFCALTLLAACGDQGSLAPFTDSRIPPGLEQRFYPPEGWTWGLVKVGPDPPARYGVSAPARRPRADVLILSGYGETAESWFETVRALNGKGYVVWVLEPVGQGGSGRYALPRDLGYATSLAPDAGLARAMAGMVIRRRPLFVLAGRTAAPAAIEALGSGLVANGVILSAPVLQPDPSAPYDRADLMRRVWLGPLLAPGSAPWRRDGPDDRALGLTHDAARGRVGLQWQTANPDLRMGGPSWGWRAAFADAARQADLATPRLTAKVLILQPDTGMGSARGLCRRLVKCTLQPFGPAGPALQLEVDKVRQAWLSAVVAFIESDIARFSPPPPTARLAPEG